MDGIELIGYLGAALMGISLGMIGSGGSILTVPILVYLIQIEPVLATAYSLFTVGITALAGGLNFARQGLVDYKVGVVFAIPAFIAVYFTRLWIVPALPDVWFSWGDFVMTTDIGILVLFGLLMVFASVSMIRNGKQNQVEGEENEVRFNFPMIILEGAVVGVLTGLVGAGGGFLIIPALVIFARLPMKKAVGTSLFIIAIKSLIGFMGDIQAGQAIDWLFLIIFSSIAIVGILVGGYLARLVRGNALQKSFGYFVLVMGVYMILKEMFL